MDRDDEDGWPLHIVQLANAFCAGEDCGFALHDALVEIGFGPGILSHFLPYRGFWIPCQPGDCVVAAVLAGKETDTFTESPISKRVCTSYGLTLHQVLRDDIAAANSESRAAEASKE